MKAIKHLITFLLLGFLLTCSDDDNDRRFNNSDPQFVRFFMLVDNNNNVLEYPEISGGLVPVSEYSKEDINTLKIPVALTATDFGESVTVNFSTELSNNFPNVDITPSNTLNFAPTQLTDTIFVNFNSNWNGLSNPSIKFVLTDVSESNINIGMPNSSSPNDELTINLVEVDFVYRLDDSFTELIGSVDEQILISIDFPNGFFAGELESLDLLTEIPSDNPNAQTINYSLERLPLDTNSSSIIYKYTVNSGLLDEFLYETKFQLNEISGYNLDGISEITLRKPLITPRDNDAFTSSNFYNLDDPFHRTYGEHWFDFNEDGICSWQSFFAFTFPVVVPSGHPNAVLYDDMDTPDTSDDIYHHAFRVGFNSNNASTTNSFDLRRWFNNESSSPDNSPGFNITEALEFFPTNGTSTTDGFVQVIEQDILVSSNTGTQHIISISGNGTYSEISPGLFEIQLEFNAFNQTLFGGMRTDIYRIYNNNSYEDPVDLTDFCSMPLDL